MSGQVIRFPVSIIHFLAGRTPAVREFNQWLRQHTAHIGPGAPILWRDHRRRRYEMLRVPEAGAMRDNSYLLRTGVYFATMREAYMHTTRALGDCAARSAPPKDAS